MKRIAILLLCASPLLALATVSVHEGKPDSLVPKIKKEVKYDESIVTPVFISDATRLPELQTVTCHHVNQFAWYPPAVEHYATLRLSAIADVGRHALYKHSTIKKHFYAERSGFNLYLLRPERPVFYHYPYYKPRSLKPGNTNVIRPPNVFN